MSYDETVLRGNLRTSEAVKRFPYDDNTGLPPILPTVNGRTGLLTIGCGWNLTANGLPDDIIDILLDRSIQTAEKTLDSLLQKWRTYSDPRQRALLELAFNMGVVTLGKFHKMLAAIEAEDWKTANSELMEGPDGAPSRWAVQVGPVRSGRISKQLLDEAA